LFCAFGSGSSELAVTITVYEPAAAARISHLQAARAVPAPSTAIGFVQTTNVPPVQPSVAAGGLAKLRPVGKVVRMVTGRGTPVLPSTSTTSWNVGPCTSVMPTPWERKTIVERSSAVGLADAAPTTRNTEAAASAATRRMARVSHATAVKSSCKQGMRTCVRDRPAPRAGPLSPAIERRALWLAEDAARELPNLPLEDALQLVHLYFERGSPKAEPAARRWLVRYLSEGTPSLRDVAKVTASLAERTEHDSGP
jgi:hypothetical protein